MDTHTSLNYYPVDRGAESGSEGPRGKWLIVDDDSLIRSVIALAFEDLTKFGTIECESGETAWEAWKGVRGIEGIITDRDMPGMNGLELAAKIHAQNPEMPIVLVTARPEGLDREELRECGIRSVLAKPFSCDDLLSALQQSMQTTTWLAAA
jgi:CheY-like chemotaxis protein